MHTLVVPLWTFSRPSDLTYQMWIIHFTIVVKIRSNDVESWTECLMQGSGEAATPLTHCSCFVFTLILWSRHRGCLDPEELSDLFQIIKLLIKQRLDFRLPLNGLPLVPCCKNHLPLHFSLKGGTVQFSSRAQSCLTLRPHGLQHTRPPCPSPTPGVYPNSCALGRWCHPTISSSVVLFFSCLQSFPASRSFQMSQFFTSGGQCIGVLASASVLPMNIQDWSPLGWTGWIS